VKGVPSDIALPSVNEFLPIGEDDLPHALPWDEIEPIDWINDWAKLDVASPEDPALIEQLAQASMARQAELEEFRFLKEQIEWRRERYEEKEISINLAHRIQRKIDENGYIDELDATYEALSENDYDAQEFLLKVAEEQDALSKENLAQPMIETATTLLGEQESSEAVVNNPVVATDQTVETEEEEEANYDIHLRESARIMADWVKLLRKPETVTALTRTSTSAR
jgi:carboxyl-terminal processing protease